MNKIKIKGLKKDYFLFGQNDCPLNDRKQIFINYVFSSFIDLPSIKLYLEALTQKNININEHDAGLNMYSVGLELIEPLRQLNEDYFTSLLNTLQFIFSHTIITKYYSWCWYFSFSRCKNKLEIYRGGNLEK